MKYALGKPLGSNEPGEEEFSMKMTRSEISRREFMIGTAAATALVGVTGVMSSSAYADTTGQSHLNCDLLVCGATPAGIAAAVTAAREGLSVILTEYEDHIGGIVTNGLTNTDLNPAHRPTVGGFFNEFTDRVVAYYRQMDETVPGRPNVRLCRSGFAYEPSVAEHIFQQFVSEHSARLQVLLRHQLKRAIMDQNRITGAVFDQRDTGRSNIQIDARVLIDATYEGDLAAMANAVFRLGREGRQEFNEPHAGLIYMKIGSDTPEPGSTGEGDKAIQAFCFRFSATTNPENRAPVEKPQGYNRSDYQYLLEDIRTGKLTRLDEIFGIFPMPNKKVEFNSLHPVPSTGLPSESLDLAEECWPWPEATFAERRRIYERYLTHNVGMLWMLQNDPEVPDVLRKDSLRYGWCKDEFVNNKNLPRQVYVREGRRIEGEYLLTEHDGFLAPGLQRTRIQPTSIALAEWRYDCHSAHRYDPAHPGVREGYTFAPDDIFQIPYGVVVPKSVDGLLVPVACSATHIAYGALRMEPVFMALGQACGKAAHLAIDNGVAVRAVSVPHLQQSLLADGGTITYFDDFQGGSEAFTAFQWLGARGLNSGYLAKSQKRLSRREGAERFRRIMEQVGHKWTGDLDEGTHGPLKYEDVATWLRSVALKVPGPDENSIDLGTPTDGIKCEEFALLLYHSLAPA
jgi:hypothetical protein